MKDTKDKKKLFVYLKEYIFKKSILPEQCSDLCEKKDIEIEKIINAFINFLESTNPQRSLEEFIKPELKENLIHIIKFWYYFNKSAMAAAKKMGVIVDKITF